MVVVFAVILLSRGVVAAADDGGAVEEVPLDMTVRDRGLPGFGAIGAFLGIGSWQWYRRRVPSA